MPYWCTDAKGFWIPSDNAMSPLPLCVHVSGIACQIFEPFSAAFVCERERERERERSSGATRGDDASGRRCKQGTQCKEQGICKEDPLGGLFGRGQRRRERGKVGEAERRGDRQGESPRGRRCDGFHRQQGEAGFDRHQRLGQAWSPWVPKRSVEAAKCQIGDSAGHWGLFQRRQPHEFAGQFFVVCQEHHISWEDVEPILEPQSLPLETRKRKRGDRKGLWRHQVLSPSNLQRGGRDVDPGQRRPGRQPGAFHPREWWLELQVHWKWQRRRVDGGARGEAQDLWRSRAPSASCGPAWKPVVIRG
jgi:hypothetical protein